MDASTFDHLARTLVTRGSRRTALGALMAAGTALGLAGQRATAQWSCSLKANGERCQRDSECCSGRCKRRPRERYGTCRQADRQSICTIEQDLCSAIGGNFSCTIDPENDLCACYVTITGRSFCGMNDVLVGNCGCRSNRGCERRIGEGTKCVQGVGGACEVACPAGTTTVCVRPCSFPAPTP